MNKEKDVKFKKCSYCDNYSEEEAKRCSACGKNLFEENVISLKEIVHLIN